MTLSERDASAPSTLEGVLERVAYANESNAWSVVKLAVPGRREPVTAVGNLLGVQPGESLRLTGRWMQDRRYGEQFRVEGYVTVAPATLVGIERYLGSGLIRGVGTVMAQRLVEHFGLATLEVIEREPARLTEVEGVGPVRSRRIRAAWDEQRAVKEVMLFLQSHGVSTGFAIKIFKAYGERAIAVVRENPYQLAFDIFGLGFKSADRIAADLGIAKTAPQRAEAGVLYVLNELAADGHVYAPRARLIETASTTLEIEAALVERAIVALAGRGHVVVEEMEGAAPAPEVAAVYGAALHAAEVGAAALTTALLAQPVRAPAFDVERALADFEARSSLTLADAQREAIRRALRRKVLVITGGPGTGKTTLVNGLLALVAAHGSRVLLCAPTGRAAKRLAEATGREARTIHRLLEFSPRGMTFARDQQHPLDADLVVVDEISMVDLVLFYHLLKAVPPPAQLVLVGDVDQLPSVGPGSVLRDLMDSGAVDVIRLTEIFRQAEESLIVVNAHRVNRGELPRLAESDGSARTAAAGDGPSSAPPDFFFIERETPEEVLATVKSLVAERIPSRFGLDPVRDIQVLTPMHKGLLGGANLNAELQALLNPRPVAVTRGSRSYRVGDKVMQLRNNYDLDVSNGDIGCITAVDEVERQVVVRYDEREVRYDQADLDEVALAYACSIHKAQGSEYPCVVIPLHTQHYVMLQRNLLYTAITRGRRLVVLVGSRRALAIAVRTQRTVARCSGLAARLAAGRIPAPGH